jgi:uncharacterized protein (TIGR03790 family)
MTQQHSFIKLGLTLTFVLVIVASLTIKVSASPQQLTADNILGLYKQGDTHSKQIADYYAEKRKIPASHLAAVAIAGNPTTLRRNEFRQILTSLSDKLTDDIKVVVMTWHAPFRVACMSITSAFAFGFDEKYCSHQKATPFECRKTAISPYYNAESSTLWRKENPFRLSMMLTGKTVAEAKKLIDRGVAADNSHPIGDAYLVRTRDKARSSRWPIFKHFAELWGDRKGVNVKAIDDRFNKQNNTLIQNKPKVLFYQTGATTVPKIETNQYLPGAIADHLTSHGAVGIDSTGQMQAFRWLEAGATASYGTVIEPCNYPEKFPNPQVLIPSYLFGNTLVEAYWKSVQQPGEGLFIGEPLARPWSKK